jgi:hypothetical protein
MNRPTGQTLDEAQFPATTAGLSRAVSWAGRRTVKSAGPCPLWTGDRGQPLLDLFKDAPGFGRDTLRSAVNSAGAARPRVVRAALPELVEGVQSSGSDQGP